MEDLKVAEQYNFTMNNYNNGTCKVTDHMHDLVKLKLPEVQTMITELLIFLKLLNKKQISNIQYLKY